MPINPSPSSNRLLAALDGVALARLLPHLTLVELTTGEIVFASGTPQAYVYFPVSATIALNYLSEHGFAAAVSLVGSEGVIGIPLFLQQTISPSRATVREGGYAFRISAALLTGELNRPGPALRLILGYARELSAQMALAAHCDVPPAHSKRKVPDVAKACSVVKH